MLWLLASLALAHPTVDDHLHATDDLAACDDIGRLRRVASLADAARYDEALTELDALCAPEAELAVLARARLTLARGDAAEALVLVTPLRGLDAAVVRSAALVALERAPEAGHVLAEALLAQPSARPEHYLDSARHLDDDRLAAEVLAAGVEALGPVGALVRDLARREASLGELDRALGRLSSTRPADRILRGDLLASAGRRSEAEAVWHDTLEQLTHGRTTPATDALRAEIRTRLETP